MITETEHMVVESSKLNIHQKLQRLKDNFSFIFQPGRKPKLFARIVRSYLTYMFNRSYNKRPLRNIDVALTYACNLKCEHCSCELMKSKSHPLVKSDYTRFAREAMDMGTIYFSFTGGEVLLRKDLEEIIQEFNPWENLIGLQTNAVLLTPERIDSLYDAGLDALQISLDSFDPDKHDKFRNQKGSYEATIANAKRALKKGIKIIFCSTITKSTLRTEETRNLLKFCEDLNCPIVVSIPCPVGNWSGNFSECFDDDDRVYFAQLQKDFPHLRRDFHSNYARIGCSAATEKLYLTPYGDIIPCPFIHLSFGNIKNEPLRAIRNRMLNLKRFTQYNQVCLAGEDTDFIEKYLRPSFDSSYLPMRWDDHPVLKEELQ